MQTKLAGCATLILALAVPQVAHAEQGAVAVRSSAMAPFGVAPVDDAMLAQVRGGQSPFAPLSVGTLSRMIDDSARADLRQTGGVGRIEMDVWWGTTGIELIAQSVRGADGL